MPKHAVVQAHSVVGAADALPSTANKPNLCNETNPDRGLRRNGRARSQPWPVPLTVLAELLYLDIASPYRAAKRFGLRNWLTAQVRAYLTRGAAFCVELDLERSIRFNAAYLARRAEFVLARKRVHRGCGPDGGKLAEVLGVQSAVADASFLEVWLQFVADVADELVEVSNFGHIEDVSWADAERYIDRVVAPRPRNLRRAGATPATLSAREQLRQPLSVLGGYRRHRRILEGLASGDPAVVAATLDSWQCRRMQIPSMCGDEDWDAAFHAIGQ